MRVSPWEAKSLESYRYNNNWSVNFQSQLNAQWKILIYYYSMLFILLIKWRYLLVNLCMTVKSQIGSGAKTFGPLPYGKKLSKTYPTDFFRRKKVTRQTTIFFFHFLELVRSLGEFQDRGNLFPISLLTGSESAFCIFFFFH